MLVDASTANGGKPFADTVLNVHVFFTAHDFIVGLTLFEISNKIALRFLSSTVQEHHISIMVSQTKSGPA